MYSTIKFAAYRTCPVDHGWQPQGVPAAPPAPAAVPPVSAAPVPPPMYVVEEPVAAAFVGASAT